MNPEEIKVGETYNVRMKLHRIDEDGDFCFRVFGGDDVTRFLKPTQVERAVYPLSAPANGTKNTEPAPKYNPYRKFREGDKVRLVEWRGRAPFDCENWEPEKAGQICIVAEDEDAERGHYLHVWKIEDMASETDEGERPWLAFPIFSLELVTPVEELEPYSVHENEYSKSAEVRRSNPFRVCAAFYWGGESPTYTREQAKEAAEAECDRLNAEYRKEME